MEQSRTAFGFSILRYLEVESLCPPLPVATTH